MVDNPSSHSNTVIVPVHLTFLMSLNLTDRVKIFEEVIKKRQYKRGADQSQPAIRYVSLLHG